MPHIGEAYFTGSVPSESEKPLGVAVRPTPDSDPTKYLNIRLSNGAAFYTAGGTSVSGGAVLTADQGAPNLLSSAWPVKWTDGTSVFGAISSPGSVQMVSGSDVVGTTTHPIWITGSVYIINPSGGGSGGNVTAVSGSVIGLLQGGQAVSSANPVPVTGSVTISNPVTSVTVTGSVVLARAIDVATLPNVTVANPQTTVTTQSGSVTGLLYGGVAAGQTNPLYITGSVGLTNQVLTSTVVSGSVVGLLVGGQPVSQANPVPVTGSITLAAVATITGSVGITAPVVVSNIVSITGSISLTQVAAITGSVSLTKGVDISSMPNVTVANPQTTVTTVSGSVTGLLQGGQAVSSANPIPITGSVSLASVATITGSVSLTKGVDISSLPNVTIANPQTTVTVISGSVTGLLLGGVAVAGSNPIPVTGSVTLAAVAAVTGSVSLTQAVTVGSLPAVSQGTAASIGAPWPVILVSGSDAVGTSTHPTWVTGSVFVLNPGGAGSNVTTQSGSVAGLLYGGVAAGQTNPFWVTGSVFVLNPGGAGSNVTAQSGSVTGLLVGGVAVAGSNPIPVTGSVTLAAVAAITGSVSLTQGATVTVTNPTTSVSITGTPNVTTVSGSITGLLVGGVAVSNANPVPVTGSVTLAAVAAVTGSVTLASAPVIASGSVSGLLVGGQPVSNANAVPVSVQNSPTVTVASTVINSGSVTGLLLGGVAVANSNPIPITGSLTLAAVAAVTGSVTLASAPVISSGSVTGLLVGGVALSNANPVPVTGTITLAAVASITGSVSLASAPVVASGSVTGLLVGGVAVAGTNPVPVTGTISLANVSAVTGTVSLASAPVIASGSVAGLLVGGVAVSNANAVPVNIQNSPTVTVASTVINSGSVTGLLYGGVAAGQTNPFWVTGSVFVLNQGGAGSNVTVQSGSITGLLVGGQPVSQANPIPTQAIGGGSSVTAQSGSVTGLLVGGVAVSNANPVPVTGSVTLTAVATITGSVTLASAPVIASGSVAGLLVGGVALSNANPVPITGSLTLAAVAAITGSVSLASAPVIASGSLTGLLVGGVAVSNANAVPVNVQNSPTVTLASTVINSGSVTGLLYGGVAASAANPFFVTGSISMTSVSAVTGSVTLAAAPAIASGSVSGLLVGGVALSNANPIPVTGSLILASSPVVKISDTNGNGVSAFPATFLRVSDEPSQIFYDPFDAALDTTNRWNAATAVGGAVAAAVAGGNLTLATGITANGYSYLQSQSTFIPTIPAWIGYSFAIKIPNPTVSNQYFFWGAGTNPGSPTTTAPLTDAFGFELYTDGKLYAVVYAAGTRTVIQDLSAATGNSKQPTDANLHRYIVYYRTDKTFFYIDGLDSNSLVATANFVSSAVQTLPVKFMAIAAAVAPLSSGILTCTGLAVWDTGKNNKTISDGTFGWRKATVKAAGAQPASTDTSLVVAVQALTGTLANGTETAVSTVAVSVLASNANRKSAIIQNTGAQTVRIGIAGVTATTGIKLVSGATIVFEPPYIVTGQFFAIRESADSIVFATEIT